MPCAASSTFRPDTTSCTCWHWAPPRKRPSSKRLARVVTSSTGATQRASITCPSAPWRTSSSPRMVDTRTATPQNRKRRMDRAGGYDEYGFVAEFYDFVEPYRQRPDINFYID